MTNEDRQSEHFIREVDEEFRRAQLKSLWDRFAPLVFVACLLVVAITAGYRGWIWWRDRQAAESGDLYLAAVEQLEAGNRAEAEATLNRLAGEGGGYAALARLRLAGDKASAGDKAAALVLFDAIAGDASAPADLRDLARLRAGLLALDGGDHAGATSRVESLAVPGNAWRHGAREVLGTAAFARGDFPAARTNFQAIQQDAEAPPDLRARAALMLTLIEGQGAAAPAPAAPAPPAAAAPANAAPSAELPVPAQASEPAPSVALPEVPAAPAPPVPEAPMPATVPAPPSPGQGEAVHSTPIPPPAAESVGAPAAPAPPAQQ